MTQRKHISLLVLAFVMLISSLVTGQVVINEAAYDVLKASGQLNPEVDYQIIIPASGQRQSAGYRPPGAGYILAIPPSDDGSSSQINLAFDFCFFGQTEKKVFINTNGNISFGQQFATSTPIQFPLAGYKIIAPYWTDVDTRARGGVWYKKTTHSLTVNWEDVGRYNQKDDKGVSFQLIITDGTTDLLPFGYNVGFFYGILEWTSGDASGGSNGFGGAPAYAAINSGDSTRFIQAGNFDSDSTVYYGPFGNPGGTGWLEDKYMYFNTCSTGNLEPGLMGHRLRDTIGICVGDTYRETYYFPAPEEVQQAAVGVYASSFPGFSLLSVASGQSASAEIEIIGSAANMGTHTIEFTVYDNGTPSILKKYEIVVLVDSLPQPVQISGDTLVCEGATTNLSVANVYQEYLWSTGGTTFHETVGAGTYRITVTYGGCERSDTHRVETHIPYPDIMGFPFICQPDTLELNALPGYDQYDWSTGDTGSQIFITQPGMHVVTVTDLGCVKADSFEVFVLNDSTYEMHISNLNSCNQQPVVLDAGYEFDAYNWSSGDTTQTINVFGGVYVLTVTLNSSDSNISCTARDTADIGIINMLPIILTGDTFICGEGATQIAVADSFDSYLWSNEQTNQATVFYASGTYGVTVTDSTCADSTHFNISLVPAPAPQIFGKNFYCPGGDSVDLWVLPLWDSLKWSTGDTSLLITVGLGWKYIWVWKDGCKTKVWHKVRKPENGFPIEGSDHICPGQSAVLTAEIGYDSYLWNNGDILPSTLVSTAGDYYVVVNVDTCIVTSDTHTVVEVFPDFPDIRGDTVMCDGATGFIYLPLKYNSYIWNTGAQVPGIYYTTPGVYSVTVEDVNQCVASDSVNITIEASPQPVIAGDTHFCFFDSALITVEDTYFNYKWSNGDTGKTALVNTGLYFVTVTDFTGCSGAAGPWKVEQSAPVAVILGDSAVCPNDEGILIADTTFSYKLYWSTEDSVSSILVSPGVYALSVTDNYGCTGVAVDTLEALPAPEAGIYIEPSGEIFSGEVVYFTDDSKHENVEVSNWLWILDDYGTISESMDTTYIYAKGGTYLITHAVSATNGCRDTLVVQLEVSAKVRAVNIVTANGDGLNDFLTFPNLEFFPGSVLNVFNRWGDLVFESFDYDNKWGGGELPTGTYFYVLTLSDGTVVQGDFTLLK